MVNVREIYDLFEADERILSLLSNAHGVHEVKVLSHLEFKGGDLTELLVGKRHLHGVVHIEPKNRRLE